MEDNKIVFTDENGAEDVFFVVEETKLNDTNYLLVTDSDDEEEAEAYIMKDISEPSDTEAVYVFVEDDDEIEAVASVFEKLLEDEELV